MTGKSKRPSRLGQVERRVTEPQWDEQITAEERHKRRAVRETVGNTFQSAYMKEPLEDWRRRIAAHEKVEGVRPDEEVSSDAVIAVEEESADWKLRWVLADQDGGLVARALHIEAKGRRTPPGGITANLLRELSPSSMAVAASNVSTETNDFSSLMIRWARRHVSEDLPTPAPHRKGRPPLSDEYLATVAAAYIEELPKGRGVLGRLGDRFGREPATMRDQVRIARDRHFLTDTRQGHKGGRPGPALLAFLAECEGQTEGEAQS
jgi:hypothetical protein